MRKTIYLVSVLILAAVGFGAVHPLKLVLDYPEQSITPNLSFNFYATSDLDNTNVASWPFWTNFPATAPITTTNGTSTFAFPFMPGAARLFIVGTATNMAGESPPSNVAASDPAPSGFPLRISR